MSDQIELDNSRNERLTMESKGVCFTIMPFGGWFDRYYADIFSPAIVDAGLLPRRADDVYRPGTIVNDIWIMAKEATIVLADLTGKNPNVLYELGLAHAIAKPVTLLADSIDDIPFDLRALRIIEYDKNAPNWGEVLRSKITQGISEILAAPLKFVLPPFLDAEKITLEADAQRPQIQLRDRSDLISIQEMAQGATEIAAAGVTLVSLVTPNYDFFAQKISEGCKLRFLLLEPNSLAWQVWHQEQRIAIPEDSESSLKTLDGLMRLGGECKVRLSKTHLHFSLVMTEASKNNGRMNVEFLVSKVSLPNRPHVHLSKHENQKWFEFFRVQFENLWSESSERVVSA